MIQFEVVFNQSNFLMGVDFNTADFNVVDFGAINVVTKSEYDYYEGDYEITPKVTKQTVETKDRIMKNDFTVNEIPVFEVSNTSGGKTVTIG